MLHDALLVGVGVVIGAWAGIITMSLLIVSRDADEQAEVFYAVGMANVVADAGDRRDAGDVDCAE